jgi:hypothetical protein
MDQLDVSSAPGYKEKRYLYLDRYYKPGVIQYEFIFPLVVQSYESPLANYRQYLELRNP